jgi:hypothetical protein
MCEMIVRRVLERRESAKKASKFLKRSQQQQPMQYRLILRDVSA